MTKPLPRAILFGILATLALMALTFFWLLGDMILMERGRITVGLIERATIFWVVTGALVAYAAGRRAASVGTTVAPAALGLLTGAVMCAIEVGAQLLSSPTSNLLFIAGSVATKLAAGAYGGVVAARRMNEPTIERS